MIAICSQTIDSARPNSSSLPRDNDCVCDLPPLIPDRGSYRRCSSGSKGSARSISSTVSLSTDPGLFLQVPLPRSDCQLLKFRLEEETNIKSRFSDYRSFDHRPRTRFTRGPHDPAFPNPITESGKLPDPAPKIRVPFRYFKSRHVHSPRLPRQPESESRRLE